MQLITNSTDLEEEDKLVMFFNVKSVREFLIKNGEVYTVRKKRFRVGNDTAVYGSRFKQNVIGKIFIETIYKVVVPERLIPFVDKSGLVIPVPACREVHLLDRKRIKLADVKMWFELAQKLSGPDNLYLYHVTMGAKTPEERIKKVIAHAKKSLQEDLDEFRGVGNGFWESVEAEILEAVKK